MKTSMITLLLLCMTCILSAQNLLPPIGGKWNVSRSADGISTFEITEHDGQPTFHVNVKVDSGYTVYNSNVAVKPGDYTFSVYASGESKEGLNTYIYSFDKAGKASLIMQSRTPAGVIDEPMLLHEQFTVPEDSVRQRVSVGVSGNGNGFFQRPSLIAGRQPKPQSNAAEQEIPAVLSGWIAEWIYLKDDPGVPRVDFSKTFTLAAEPTSAFVQLTADNGYDLLVNGKSVGSDVDWRNVELYDIAKYLRKGENTMEVHVMNHDDIGGLLLQGQIVDSGGKSTEIISDRSWKISLPDGKPAEMTVHGKVPVSPWGKLPFHRTMPPKVLNLDIVESTTEIVAGDVLHYVFKVSDELLRKKSLKLSMRFIDAEGRATPLSAFSEFVRIVPEYKRLYVELATSPYAMPGSYRAEIHGGGFVIPVGTVWIRPSSADNIVRGKFPKPTWNNYAYGDDRNATPLITYSLYSSVEESHYRSWAETGGHFYETNLPAGYWTNKNIFSSTDCEHTLLKILENAPKANIVLKFRLDTPGWWVAAHPNDVYVSNKGRRVLQSFCSEAWRKDAIEAVARTVRELSVRPVGNAITGVLLMGFRGGEFQLWGEDTGEYDCSPVAKKAFADYLKSKGIDKSITLPHPALEFPLDDVDADGASVRDLYFRFVAERQADNLAFFIKEFRRRFGDRYAIGMYFGYGLEYAGGNTRMLLAGHLALERLLAETPPDFLSCPLSYSLRPFNRSHAFMFPVDSARLHNVMPIGENDVRNFLTPETADSSGMTIFSLADSIADNRRIRLFEAAHGAIVRYLALHPTVDWYFDHSLVRSIRQDNEFIKPLTANSIGDNVQVALVVNYLEWTRGWRIPEETFKTFAGNARDTLMRTGRAVSFVTCDDYITNVREWQNALIPVPGLLTDSQRTALEAAHGKLPPINLDDGALVLLNGKWSVLGAKASAMDIWKTFATKEALAAGFDTIWYVGGNFKFSWNGKRLSQHQDPKPMP